MRRSFELIVTGGGIARGCRRLLRERVAVIAYHNVIASADGPVGDASLHLSFDGFSRQLDRLTETHQIVPLSGLEQKNLPSARPEAAITFDDAYIGALRLAVPELVRRKLPATIFVCPGLLGAGGFWWDVLAGRGPGLSASLRQRALESCQGRQQAVLESASPQVSSDPELRPSTLKELAEAASQPGITVASHTWGHPNLAALSHDEVAEELSQSRDWLLEHFPASTLPTHVSFPYGLYNENVVRIATGLGFDHLYRIEGGLARMEGEPPHLLPRINVPAGVSLRGFELRTSGVLG